MEQLIIDTKLITQFKQDNNSINLLRGFLWQLAHLTEACQGIIYEIKMDDEKNFNILLVSFCIMLMLSKFHLVTDSGK